MKCVQQNRTHPCVHLIACTTIHMLLFPDSTEKIYFKQVLLVLFTISSHQCYFTLHTKKNSKNNLKKHTISSFDLLALSAHASHINKHKMYMSKHSSSIAYTSHMYTFLVVHIHDCTHVHNPSHMYSKTPKS